MRCIEIGPMTYSVHQHWDPLRVCVVGRSYPPEFYDYIANSRVRRLLCRIAEETEEDYQGLIQLLQRFGVEVLRPEINRDRTFYLRQGRYEPPPMTPCDWSIMIGDRFFHNWRTLCQVYHDIRDASWPVIDSIQQFDQLPAHIRHETECVAAEVTVLNSQDYQHILDRIQSQGNDIIERPHRDAGAFLNRAMITRVGRDLYFGTASYFNQDAQQQIIKQHFGQYRCHVIDTQGHSDATYCVAAPGLIISLCDVDTYQHTFPGWRVVYVPHQDPMANIPNWMHLKLRNSGKWWVPGQELNDEFTDYVESWLSNWMGYVAETQFDINMLVIDRHNIATCTENPRVIDALSEHGITTHIVPFRHRWFWDGGLHCMTSDLHRSGHQQDCFAVS